MSSTGHADLRLLGAVELLGPDGERIGLGPARQRCLLAVLAMSPGRPVARDFLVDRVWSMDAPPGARDAVYAYVSRLRGCFRRAGAPGALRRADRGYVLDLPSGRVDLHRCRSLVHRARDEDLPKAAELMREASGLWRGTPLAGLEGGWAERTRAGLLQERVTLLTKRFDAELRLGRHSEAVAELLGAVGDHPLAEPLTAHLMLALYRTGRLADSLAAYDALRRHLVEELGEDPGRQLQDLYARILRRDPALDHSPERTPAKEPAAAPPVCPAQLPPDLPGFAGRRDFLGLLDSLPARTADAALACVITGTAGVGKTALAVHWAHRRADRFPDGQLYVDLRGFSDSGSAVEPDQVLRSFLRTLGLREDSLPPDVAGLSALFRSALAGRRMLLVLDNARDLDQVRPLLPAAPGCLALVTSRHELTGLLAVGAVSLPLRLLTTDEATELLTGRLGADRLTGEPDAAGEIIAHCAGLPLALAVVAAHAAQRPGFRLADLAEELRRERGGLTAFSGGDATTDLRSVFSWSYRGLSPRRGQTLPPHRPVPQSAPGAGCGGGPDRQPRIRRPGTAVGSHPGQPVHRAPTEQVHHPRPAARLRQRAGPRERARGRPARRRSPAARPLPALGPRRLPGAVGRTRPSRQHRARAPEHPGGTLQRRAEALAWLTAERHALLAAVQLAARTEEMAAHAARTAAGQPSRPGGALARSGATAGECRGRRPEDERRRATRSRAVQQRPRRLPPGRGAGRRE